MACWRRPSWRVVAALLPVIAWSVAVTDHFGYNALADPNWTDAPHERAPWLIRTAWPLLGHGTGKGWLLLLVLLACLLVDARRLRSAGPLTDLDADGWTARPRLLTQRWTPTVRDRLTGSSAKLVAPVQAVVDLLVYAGRDLAVLLTAHTKDGDEPRRAALLRGRAAAVMLREIRTDAIAATVPAAADERRARRTSRAVAVLSLVILVVFGTVYALTLARHIGTDLTPPTAWLAGQFDQLAQWWHTLSPLQKLLAGAGVAALIALSGGSLGMALGASGAFTYVAEHGAGAADFTRDPIGATRSWLATTTPTGAALDLAEFALTFAPSNFAGAAAGRSIRAAAREYADDPAAFWARRRAWLADGERGSIRIGDGPEWNPGDLLPDVSQAQIDRRKIVGYALNVDNAVGANKARVFRAATGFDESTADDLIRQLHEGVRQNPAELGLLDEYGQRFRVDIPVHGPTGEAMVRTAWIIDPGKTVPRLVTAYIK